MTTITVRDLGAGDEIAWRSMWDGYCKFYNATVASEITDGLWLRLLDATSAIKAIVSEYESGEITGFANYILHPYTWGLNSICYLEDLYVCPQARGKGSGKSLIDALLTRARENDWGRIYWMTDARNETARKLYDQYAQADGFVRYTVKVT